MAPTESEIFLKCRKGKMSKAEYVEKKGVKWIKGKGNNV